jgi:nicotinate phosphoribosyltransferase
MAQVVAHKFSQAQVEYEFVCRSKNVDLLPYTNDIRAAINDVGNLELSKAELDYLKTISFLNPAFINSLRGFKLDPSQVMLYNMDGNLQIQVKGSWISTIWWETIILAIVNEIYFREKTTKAAAFKIGMEQLNAKIDKLNNFDYSKYSEYFRFSDFGTRRRYSAEWHDKVIETLAGGLSKDIFTGTSNVYLAMKYKIKPIGTQAHEFFMAHQALYPVYDSQQMALKNWNDEFNGNLAYALTDTISMDAFLKDFTLLYAKSFDGCRHDSGDPIVWCNKLIAHYEKLGIDPTTKLAIFSDGLTVDSALALYKKFDGKIMMSFGIGTSITNDVGLEPINIVMKMVKCNSHPVAKLSDSPGKNICDDEIYLAYLRRCFNI